MKLNKGTRKKRLIVPRSYTILTVAALLILLVGPAPVAAIEAVQQPGVMGTVQNQGENQDPQAQDLGNNDMNVQEEDGPGIQEGDQNNQQGQEYQDAQDLGDLPGSGDMNFFDPDSIPESVFPEDADWAFNIPVSVSNLPPEVEKLGIICETMYWVSGGETKFEPGANAMGGIYPKVTCGRAVKQIEIDNGAYTGNIILGIQMTPGARHDLTHLFWAARKYACWMYLVGDNGSSWEEPVTGPTAPGWRRADANQPFNWQTGLQDIPLASRPNPPDYDLEDAGGAMNGAVGNN